ncbi:MAG TPA: beta-glucosidase BglX [Terracidiphilus sp.]|nr:beta-glucosidase BglX [Terracidiphilus sp.]
MRRLLIGSVCLIAALVTVGASAPPAQAQQEAPSNTQLASREINDRVDALLKKMTLDEKIGQLVQYSAGDATGPAASKLTYDQLVAQGRIGSLLNVVGAEKTNHYQHIAMEKSRLHIPILFGLDVIHGHRTTFPIPLAVAASWDPGAAETVARVGAEEARADGIAWVFSPMVDISRDPRWGRIVESNGEDPYLSSVMARAWVKGYQQDDLSKPDSVAACVKHFAAYGAAIAGRDYNATDMSEITLRQVYLRPYHAAVEAGVATVMSSFNSINGVPATANPFILKQVLRREWRFDGFVVSDWGAVAELLNHAIGASGADVARKALEAGVDMDMEGNLYGTTLAAQVRSGRIPESVVDEAVRRILRVKFVLGLFDHPYTPPSAPYVATPAKRALARKVADETIVLLKNDPVEGVGALLPLSATVKKVALIGPMADDQRDLEGAWTVTGNPKDVITLKAELEKRLGGRLLYARGCGLLSGEDENVLRHVTFGGPDTVGENLPVPDDAKTIAEAVATAKQADVVIMALGEPTNWMEGEASSRVHLGFTGAQEKLLEAVTATGKPVILVVLAGRPLVLKWAAEHVPAMVEAWSPGIEAGPAVADVLFGDVNPSGKLPASLPRAVGQEPLYYAQMPTGRPAHGDLSHMPRNAAEKFISRYMDEQNSALFPFGWGLSYTRFRYSQPAVSRTEVGLGEVLAGRGPVETVSVDVTNTGSVTGTEVAQLYVRNTVASVEQPVRELKGFARVTLQPGETKHLTFPLGFDELSFYNVEAKQTVEPTTYDVWVGGSSLATEKTSFKVE